MSNLSLSVSIPVITVFLQGLLSFFSPCILPLLPLYIGYLSGGMGKMGEDGRMRYPRGRVFLHTVCFCFGVSFTFFFLGMSAQAAGSFFRTNQLLLARVGGVLVILFGLYQLGVFGFSSFLGTERRLNVSPDQLVMSPFAALLMGFFFSFSWTPCVGPALTSVLLMTASAQTSSQGFALIGVYTLGFILPFLAVGLFTSSLLELFKRHRGVVRYTVKLGGVLMIGMGLLMCTGKMNSVTGYLSQFGAESGTTSQAEGVKGEESGSAKGEDTGGAEKNDDPQQDDSAPVSGIQDEDETDEQSEEQSARPTIPALAFELEDQNGDVHRLEDYRGKMIFLNFWATWCPPCRAELPDIQALYESSSGENSDLAVLGVAAPGLGQEKDRDGVTAFLEENGLTYPVLMDMDGALFSGYGISAFPTTLMIDPEGNVYGYVSGQLSYEMMEDIVRQVREGSRSAAPEQ